METITPQSQTKQPQPPADDWSFLDGTLDWEALLDEPILETVMEDAALDMSPNAFSGPTDSQRSQDTDVALAQLNADQQSQLQMNAQGARSGSLPPVPAALPASLGSSSITSIDITPPSMLAGLQAAVQVNGGFQSLLNGCGPQANDMHPNGIPRQPDASSPEAAQQATTSSGDLRHTSSGDTSLRTAMHSNSGDDAETTHKAHTHPQRHGSAKLLAARQAAATAREKNRAAQRRYRSRKKEQLLEVDERLAEMQRQLAQLQLDKEQLAQRNQLLERVASLHQQQQQAEAQEARPASTPERAHTWWQDEHLVDIVEDRMQLRGPFLFTIKPDRPMLFTRKQVVNMPVQWFRSLYRDYVNAFAGCLLEVASNPDSPSLVRLERLVWEAGQMKCAVMLSPPALMTHLHQLITGRAPDRTPAMTAATAAQKQQQQQQRLVQQLAQPQAGEPLTDADWDQIVGGAQLTAEQRDAILALRAAYYCSIGALTARRRQLITTIQMAMPPGGADWELVTSADAYGSATLGAFDRLQATLRDEHTVQMLYSLSVWRRVLKPLQMAHLNVTAFPHKPYVTHLAEAVARASGAPQQAELMAAGARESAPLLSLDGLEAVLPASMRAWGTVPRADLAALYPGVELPADMIAAAGYGGGSAQGADSHSSVAAAAAAAAGIVCVKQEPGG